MGCTIVPGPIGKIGFPKAPLTAFRSDGVRIINPRPIRLVTRPGLEELGPVINGATQRLRDLSEVLVVTCVPAKFENPLATRMINTKVGNTAKFPIRPNSQFLNMLFPGIAPISS